MTNIGVEISTSVRSGPSNDGTPSGRFHIAGITERGPVDRFPVLASIAEFEAVYGTRTPSSAPVYDTARLFFEEGGAELVVSRAVGPNAARGSLTLQDRAGTPVDTVKVEAVDPGAHSAGMTVEVADASSGLFTVTIRSAGAVVQRFANLATPAELVEAAYRSPYVRITNLGSATAAPGNAPKVIAATSLVAGDDDRAAVDAAAVVAALDAAGDVAPGGGVATPGYTAETVAGPLLAHAAAKGKIAYLATDVDATVAEAVAAGVALATVENGSYGAIFYPHVVVPDGTRTRTISPEGYVAAARARAHTEIGYWQVPAGERAETRWVIDTVTPVDTLVNNELSEARVNGIVTTGTRVRLYGWASLSEDRDNFALLSVRDLLNNLTVGIRAAAEPHVFDGIDGRGWMLSKLRSDVVGVLAPVAARGGLFARVSGDTVIDPGYSVRVDPTINPLSSLANDEVHIRVAVRPSPSAQLIKGEIIRVPLTATV